MAQSKQTQEKISILDAIRSQRAFRGFFEDLKSWEAWFVFLKALTHCEPLNAEELELLEECTGLSELPREQIRECFMVCGRRSGKSTMAAILAVFFAVFGDWQRYVSKGEKPMIFVVSVNKAQSGVIMSYVKAIFDLNASLRNMVRKVLSESIRLTNGVEIHIKPSSFRSLRGFSVGVAILEELAFWRFESESANQDQEVYNALRPSMRTIPNSLVIGLSTPFARSGLLFQKFHKHYGKPEGCVLVWKAPSWVMNRTLIESEIESEFLPDLGESAYAAEFRAEFREDVEDFLSQEIINRMIVEERSFLGYDDEVSEYFAFADPSEGTRKGADSFAFAISHVEKYKDSEDLVYVLDYLYEAVPPFSPKEVIREIVQLCRSYKVTKIIQDRHSIAWIGADLEEHGIYVEASKKTKSELYQFFSVMATKDEVELLDNKKLRSQLMSLQRSVRSGGLVKIDHPVGGYHDDVANAMAGSLDLCKTGLGARPDIIFFN